MVVGAANRVFIDVGELRFNPCSVIALFVENSAHSVAEAVACYSPRIPDAAYENIHSHFAHRLTVMNPSRENKLIVPGDWL